MVLGVVKERFPGERRVSLVPNQIQPLIKKGLAVLIENDAGSESGYPDQMYADKGAVLVGPEELLENADVILCVRAGSAGGEPALETAKKLRSGQIIIGLLDPWDWGPCFELYIKKEITSFALERIPRITKAQSMDVLSSMANLAGYKSVLLAANYLPKMFPMMMTAAGTIVPAKVFIVGVGVAGLQAIATAKRLGAVVSAYDVRPAVKEQVESLGAKFVDMELETSSTEGSGGYAREMNEEFYRKQREFMRDVCGQSDVVITTAAIPGKKSPILVTDEMVQAMKPGSVIVDLAVERGGNCELSKKGQVVSIHGVTIVGLENIPSTLGFHASQLYGKNIETFLTHLLNADGEIDLRMHDEIIGATMVTHQGHVPTDTETSAINPEEKGAG